MHSEQAALAEARAGDHDAFARLIAPYRRELRAHCYRMAGALHEADDLLQESLLRAWRGLDSFEGRSSLRTWLYRVTTHACLDALDKKSARVLPQGLGPPVDGAGPFRAPMTDPIWIEPGPTALADDLAPAPDARPDARYDRRESVALAFLVALQLLPPKQRAVLVLRDVLGWQASECAELLDLSVAAINSALQRARETLSARAGAARAAPPAVDDAAQKALLGRYVDAWERADVNALVSLLHEDATLAMPPISEWVQGARDIGTAVGAMVFAPAGPGFYHLVATEANGLPAFAAYARDPATGELRARALHVLELSGDRIAALTAFIDPSLFAAFDLPDVWRA